MDKALHRYIRPSHAGIAELEVAHTQRENSDVTRAYSQRGRSL